MGDIPTISYDKLHTTRGHDSYLGRGNFSDVYHCYHNALGDVAVKILTTNRNAVRSFGREGDVHFKASIHPRILRLLGIAQSSGNNFVGLVVEYMPNGDLANLVLTPKKIDVPWTFRLRALSETAAAMAFLHNLAEDRRVIHCDLKVENILLDSDLHVKIADFGGAKFQSLTGTSIESTIVSGDPERKGLLQYTLSYAAPEFLSNLFAKRTTEMDVYSFAIVIFVIITRCHPYPGVTEELIRVGVKEGQRPSSELENIEKDLTANVENKNIFSLLCHIMKICWQQNPKDRLQMIQVRDSFEAKLRSIGEEKISHDVFTLKQQLPKNEFGGMPKNPISILQKHQQICTANQLSVEVDQSDPRHSVPSQEPEKYNRHASLPATTSHANQPMPNAARPANVGIPDRAHRSQSENQPLAGSSSVESITRSLSHAAVTEPKSPLSLISRGIKDIERNFSDPFLREGDDVRMITDLAAIKNAQVGHGGWNESLMRLRCVQGNVRKVEDNGDVNVSFSGVKSHRFNPSSLVKLPTDDGLIVGDFVIINMEMDLVRVLQEEHGGWVDDMRLCSKHHGLLFRFLPNRDVLVVYNNGKYFRFNPLVLSKSPDKGEFSNLRLPDNPDIRVGDYCYHDLEEDVLKMMQDEYGGWNESMTEVRGKVGKVIYVDYHGRAFVAYNSKLCFMLNPGVVNRLSKQDAAFRYENNKEEARKKTARAKAAMQLKPLHYKVGDHVRVHLPLETLIGLQKGHGGWCYKMLEVYGLVGIVKGFDDMQNTEVLYDTGNKWTFHLAALEPVNINTPRSGLTYVPPYHIGDKVRVNLDDINNLNLSLNEIEHAMKMFDIPEEKVALLKKPGTVLGIDDDMDVIVTFGDEKRYGLKPEQLKKIEP